MNTLLKIFEYDFILKNYLISFFFLILALVFYIPYYKKFKANIRLINGKDNEQFIYYSSLKIKNNLELFLILFYVLIYIIFNILLFIYLRAIQLDFKFPIMFINPYNIFFSYSVSIIISFIIFLYAYIQFTDVVFFPQIVKLYIYVNKIIYPLLFDYIRENRYIVNRKILRPVLLFLRYSTDITFRKSIDYYCEDRLYDYQSFFYSYKKRRLFFEYVKNKKILFNLIHILVLFLELICKYIDSFFRQILIPLLILILIYDINKGSLYYIYYALFFYTIIVICRKFIEFVWALDIYGIDYKIHELLYEGVYFPNIKETTKLLEELDKKCDSLTNNELKEYNDMFAMLAKQQEIYPLTNEYLTYLLGNLKVRDILDNGDPLNRREIVWPVRRLIMLIFSIFSLYYICVFHQITIYIFQLPYNLTFFIGIFVFISIFVLWHRTGYIEDKRYGTILEHYSYLIIVYSISIFALFIFINHSFILTSKDIILNTSIIYIVDNFTLDDKLFFFCNYFKYFIIKYNINESEALFIFNSFQSKGYFDILNNINIKAITTDVETVILHLTLIKEISSNILDVTLNFNYSDNNFFASQYYEFIKNTIFIINISKVFIEINAIMCVTYDLYVETLKTSYTLGLELIKQLIKR